MWYRIKSLLATLEGVAQGRAIGTLQYQLLYYLSIYTIYFLMELQTLMVHGLYGRRAIALMFTNDYVCGSFVAWWCYRWSQPWTYVRFTHATQLFNSCEFYVCMIRVQVSRNYANIRWTWFHQVARCIFSRYLFLLAIYCEEKNYPTFKREKNNEKK